MIWCRENVYVTVNMADGTIGRLHPKEVYDKGGIMGEDNRIQGKTETGAGDKMIVNEFTFTKELIKEYVLHHWKKFLIVRCCIVALIVVFYLYALIALKWKSALIVLALGLMFPVFCYIRIRRDYLNVLERNRIKFGDETPVHTVEINENIVVKVKEENICISPDNIKKYTQTKHLLIIYIKGSMAVVLKKDSFLQGSAEECIALIKKYKNEK